MLLSSFLSILSALSLFPTNFTVRSAPAPTVSVPIGLTSVLCSGSHPTGIPTVAQSKVIAGTVCPVGYTLFYHESAGFIPLVKPAAVWSVIGDFFDMDWQGLDVVSTSGTDYTVGAVRTFQYGTTTASERLDCTYTSNAKDRFVQVFNLQGTIYTAAFDTTVTDVSDYLTVYASNGGAQIVWYIGGCSTNTTASLLVFSAVHDGAVAGVVAEL